MRDRVSVYLRPMCNWRYIYLRASLRKAIYRRCTHARARQRNNNNLYGARLVYRAFSIIIVSNKHKYRRVERAVSRNVRLSVQSQLWHIEKIYNTAVLEIVPGENLKTFIKSEIDSLKKFRIYSLGTPI